MPTQQARFNEKRRFMVFDGSPQEYEVLQKTSLVDFQKRILAVWETHAGKPGEMDWIERLVCANEANRFFTHARHDRYTALGFFVRRLSLWDDIALHWKRRNEIARSDAFGFDASLRSSWLTVSYFSKERLDACPPEAIFTIDALSPTMSRQPPFNSRGIDAK